MFKTIEQVWKALESSKIVYWSNQGYKVYISEALQDNDYQRNHFSFKNGKVLSVRCIDNYFGSLINESDLSTLFVEE